MRKGQRWRILKTAGESEGRSRAEAALLRSAGCSIQLVSVKLGGLGSNVNDGTLTSSGKR